MNKIYTIGHSLVGTNDFLKKLREHQIDILVDVRTIPYSHRAKQFNREILDKVLTTNKIKYLYRGKNLGGLGENIDYFETVDELSLLSKQKTIVLMCSEGEYKKCHRYTTLTPSFEKNGVLVEHILWKENGLNEQQSLFS
jgi:uncharacterized protein (DUF488 family)